MAQRMHWRNQFAKEFEFNSRCNVRASALYEDEVELSLVKCTVLKDNLPIPTDDFSLSIGRGLVLRSYADLDSIKKEQRMWLRDPPSEGSYTLWLKPQTGQTNVFGFDYACLTCVSTSMNESDTAGISASEVPTAVGSKRDTTGNYKHKHEITYVQLFTVNATYDGQHTLQDFHVRRLIDGLLATNIHVLTLSHLFIVPEGKAIKVDTRFTTSAKVTNAATVIAANYVFSSADKSDD